MAEKTYIAALDIGTSQISVAVAQLQPASSYDSQNRTTLYESSGDDSAAPKVISPAQTPRSSQAVAPLIPHIVGVGSAPSRGLRKGVVINIEATVESIAKAIEQAEKMSGQKITEVVASLSGAHINGINSHGIVGVRNREVSSYDIEKVLEAAKAVAIPLDREILHVLPQEYILDEQDGIKDPLGISGVRLEAKVHLISSSISSAQNLVKCANRCGLTVKDVVVSGLAAARAVCTPEEMELGVCVLDIGGGTTDITVYQAGSVRFTTVIPIGGNHITSDIAAGLRTPISAAEEIKCRYGSVHVVRSEKSEQTQESDGYTIEVPAAGERATRTLSASILAEIIEPRVSELFLLVRKELERAGVDEMCTSGIVLTGGTSNLRQIRELAVTIFRVPVRVGAPRGFHGITDLISTPQTATLAGLISFASDAHRVATLSQPGSSITEQAKKAWKWVSNHF